MAMQPPEAAPVTAVDDRQRVIWLALRRALLMVVVAIEQAYGLQSAPYFPRKKS